MHSLRKVRSWYWFWPCCRPTVDTNKRVPRLFNPPWAKFSPVCRSSSAARSIHKWFGWLIVAVVHPEGVGGTRGWSCGGILVCSSSLSSLGRCCCRSTHDLVPATAAPMRASGRNNLSQSVSSIQKSCKESTCKDALGLHYKSLNTRLITRVNIK